MSPSTRMIFLIACSVLQETLGAGFLSRRPDWHWSAAWDVTVPEWKLPAEPVSKTSLTIVPTGDTVQEELSAKMHGDLTKKLEETLTKNILNSLKNPTVRVVPKQEYDAFPCEGKACPRSAQSLLKGAKGLSDEAAKEEVAAASEASKPASLLNGGGRVTAARDGTEAKKPVAKAVAGAMKVAVDAPIDSAKITSKAAKLGSEAAHRSVDMVASEVEAETSRMIREANTPIGVASALMDVPAIPTPYPDAVLDDPFKPAPRWPSL